MAGYGQPTNKIPIHTRPTHSIQASLCVVMSWIETVTIRDNIRATVYILSLDWLLMFDKKYFDYLNVSTVLAYQILFMYYINVHRFDREGGSNWIAQHGRTPGAIPKVVAKYHWSRPALWHNALSITTTSEVSSWFVVRGSFTHTLQWRHNGRDDV